MKKVIHKIISYTACLLVIGVIVSAIASVEPSPEAWINSYGDCVKTITFEKGNEVVRQCPNNFADVRNQYVAVHVK